MNRVKEYIKIKIACSFLFKIYNSFNEYINGFFHIKHYKAICNNNNIREKIYDFILRSFSSRSIYELNHIRIRERVKKFQTKLTNEREHWPSAINLNDNNDVEIADHSELPYNPFDILQ
jgi:hypothetical protein